MPCIGLLLPCSVVVRRDGDSTIVQELDRGAMVTLTGLPAHNHPAPPELLLRSYLEHRGTARDLLTERPRFPVAGLGARFTDADAADERRLAVLDPGLAPGAGRVRLTRDPDSAVRAGAARHPRLPGGRLLALLGDEELGAHAAANPALPVSVMRGLLT